MPHPIESFFETPRLAMLFPPTHAILLQQCVIVVLAARIVCWSICTVFLNLLHEVGLTDARAGIFGNDLKKLIRSKMRACFRCVLFRYLELTLSDMRNSLL